MNAELATWLFSVTTFALSTSGTPGPNNAMVAASGATYGFARTLPHMAGIAVGFPLMLAAVALGAGGLLHAYPIIHDVLRWAGIAYLLWLAFKIATTRPTPAASAPSQGTAGKPLGFWQAALFQWVNPKAWVIALGAVATYTTVDGGGVLSQVAALFAIFLVVTFLAVAFWTAMGVGAAKLLRTERGLRMFNWAMAALLVLSLVTLLHDH